MALSIEQVHPAEAVRDLDEAPLVRHGILPLPRHWGDLTFELRNHIEGWITVIRGSQTADTGHPLLLTGGWISPPRESGATVVLHPRLEEAEVALGRALADAVTVTACTTKSWDDNNRIAVAQEAGTARWTAAWLHNGVPGFTEHDSWKAAQTDAARQLDAMADSFILTGDTYTAAIASAHLRRCANQVRAQVLTADLGNVIRSHKEEMQNERRVTKIANGLGVQRPFLYRVFNGTEWTQ
ncbi:hypothetical protein [Streptomyces sp. B29(2018)]|uniref:hypothetical protein n=1 Tax=Streptomyces sp. B29(2018) TaxID=2485016 RepID=UPI000FD64390|nr:hypothetical protein [Streptomyces sp. B29(2018)]